MQQTIRIPRFFYIGCLRVLGSINSICLAANFKKKLFLFSGVEIFEIRTFRNAKLRTYF